MTQLEHLQKLVGDFCEAREWTQFHTLKDLTIGLSTESNELLQRLRFKTDDECEALLKNQPDIIHDELADVFYYLLRIADLYDLDLQALLEAKMLKNKAKYPLEKSKGNNLKYDEFEPGE